MSLLARYTLKDAADHDHQKAAMAQLVTELSAQSVPVHYSCFATDEATQFLGVLEFADDDAFKTFQASDAFEAYKAKVGPTFANPPQTIKLSSIASTRG